MIKAWVESWSGFVKKLIALDVIWGNRSKKISGLNDANLVVIVYAVFNQNNQSIKFGGTRKIPSWIKPNVFFRIKNGGPNNGKLFKVRLVDYPNKTIYVLPGDTETVSSYAGSATLDGRAFSLINDTNIAKESTTGGSIFNANVSSFLRSDVAPIILNNVEHFHTPEPIPPFSLLDERGDFNIKLGLEPTEVIMLNDEGKWILLATDEGELYTELLPPNDPRPVTNYQFKKSDNTYVAIEVDDEGMVILRSPPTFPGTTIPKIYLQTPSGFLYGIYVTDEEVFYTEDTDAQNPAFKITNQNNQVLFAVREQNSLALTYLPVYSEALLPDSPYLINNTLPWAFYDSKQGKVPVYFDGSQWRYFKDNGRVRT